MTKSFLFIFLVVTVLSACTPPVNNVKLQDYYTLNYYGSDNRADKPIYGYVKVDLPHISTKHMTESINYSKQPYQKNSYSQSKWKEPLPILLQEWLVQSLEQMHLFEGVIRVASRANVPLMLETDIVSFEHLVYADKVNVTLRALLIKYSNREILKQKLFNYQVNVKTASADGAVLAFNETMKQFDNDLYHWLRKDAYRN